MRLALGSEPPEVSSLACVRLGSAGSAWYFGSARSVGLVGFGSARLGFLSARLGVGAAGAERKLGNPGRPREASTGGTSSVSIAQSGEPGGEGLFSSPILFKRPF